ncbi:MAG: urate hydroxylase PuuD [Acidobacteria bacterium]|nr:urate hydroxylase PuuD [Acidobacteriota bacterium]MCB9399542.1 urate hydroxylase PuuD [Acidobacteriota bacterium]
MDPHLYEWLLLLVRWLHITTAITWIGTSIFFIWLDRTLEPDPQSTREGHVGALWMVHGGGFYHVEKMLMGPTKVPEVLHWFKWESYWTWMSGAVLVLLIFYTGGGTFLLDASVSKLTFLQAALLGGFSIFGSWFFYDFLWERDLTRHKPWIGHLLTMAWLAGMSYLLCHTLSGRAAFIHIGGMIGTWMTANVFLRIIPRQVKMVEATQRGEAVNQDWGKNAKNRSTHNTYLTLPVIFIMISNHFPSTYGHRYNWLILLILCVVGAAIRAYFVDRLRQPKRALQFAVFATITLLGLIIWLGLKPKTNLRPAPATGTAAAIPPGTHISGTIRFEGPVPERQPIQMEPGCLADHPDGILEDQVLVQDGKLANVFIQITSGLEGKPTGLIPDTAVELDQYGCIYRPRVVGVRTGQTVEFINSDSVFHNVRTVTQNNNPFNDAMPFKAQRIQKTFANPEQFIEAKCDVHPWMKAYIAVMDHAYFAVSDTNGTFKLPDLAPGTYTVQAWHEIFGTLTQQIEVTDQSELQIEFTFQGQQP